MTGKMAGFPDTQILAIRAGTAVLDNCLDAPVLVVRNIAVNRDHADRGRVAAIFAAGGTKASFVDVVIAIGEKTVTLSACDRAGAAGLSFRFPTPE